MIYQLPNGKVLWLTTEEYLNLTDEEIVYIVSLGYGESANSPWIGSVLSDRTKGTNSEDDALDYSDVFDDYGADINNAMSLDDIDTDMYPEIPDDDGD